MGAYEDALAQLSAPNFRWTFDGNLNNSGATGGLNGAVHAGSSSFVSSILPGSDQTQALQLGLADIVAFPDSTLINTGTTMQKLVLGSYQPDAAALDGTKRVVFEEGGGTNGIILYTRGADLILNSNAGGANRGSVVAPGALAAGTTVLYAIRMVAPVFELIVDGALIGSFDSGQDPFPTHGADIAIGGADGATKDADNANISVGASGVWQDLNYWAEQALPTVAQVITVHNAAVTQAQASVAVHELSPDSSTAVLQFGADPTLEELGAFYASLDEISASIDDLKGVLLGTEPVLQVGSLSFGLSISEAFLSPEAFLQAGGASFPLSSDSPAFQIENALTPNQTETGTSVSDPVFQIEFSLSPQSANLPLSLGEAELLPGNQFRGEGFSLPYEFLGVALQTEVTLYALPSSGALVVASEDFSISGWETLSRQKGQWGTQAANPAAGWQQVDKATGVWQ